MPMTEDEAKGKTCPFMAMLAVSVVHAAAALGGPNAKLKAALDISDPFCIDSQCMLWRAHGPKELKPGICGLKARIS